MCPPESTGKFKSVKYFIFDLDGVLLLGNETEKTNEETFINIDKFARKLEKEGYKMAIFTGRELDHTTKRLEAGGIISVFSSIDKVKLADNLLKKEKLNFENLFYMGDGLFDIPLLQKTGISAAPVSARREVKRMVDYVLEGDTTTKLLNNLWKLISKIKVQN